MTSDNRSMETRRVENDERVEFWRSLTTAEKLASLDKRLGVGVGAKRQRAKLEAK